MTQCQPHQSGVHKTMGTFEPANMALLQICYLSIKNYGFCRADPWKANLFANKTKSA